MPEPTQLYVIGERESALREQNDARATRNDELGRLRRTHLERRILIAGTPADHCAGEPGNMERDEPGDGGGTARPRLRLWQRER